MNDDAIYSRFSLIVTRWQHKKFDYYKKRATLPGVAKK